MIPLMVSIEVEIGGLTGRAEIDGVHQADKVQVLPDIGEAFIQHCREPLPDAPLPFSVDIDHRFETAEVRPHQLQEEALLASEVVIKDRFCHTGGLHEFPDRGRGIAPLREQPERRLHEFLPDVALRFQRSPLSRFPRRFPGSV